MPAETSTAIADFTRVILSPVACCSKPDGHEKVLDKCGVIQATVTGNHSSVPFTRSSNSIIQDWRVKN
jgi:hypothetical protein